MNWLETLVDSNKNFVSAININDLPTQRQPCRYAMITCMDPRINLDALGIHPFNNAGEIQSQVRIIRTLGARVDERSLAVAIHLAGVQEVAVVMHTDCGCCLAWNKINTIIDNLSEFLPQDKLHSLQTQIGELNEQNLRTWLKAFPDPYAAVVEETRLIKDMAFVHEQFIVHGLVYNLASGKVDVVVNGYQQC